MGQPYIGEIRMFAGNFAPVGWAFCDGSVQDISQNDTLFTLIGTTYGGDGQNTFNLPDLRGRLPVHMGQGSGLNNYVIGELTGSENIQLNYNHLPFHTHTLAAEAAGGTTAVSSPTGAYVAGGSANLFGTTGPAQAMDAHAVSMAGGSLPHSNVMPYLCVSFIISLFGVFPSQN